MMLLLYTPDFSISYLQINFTSLHINRFCSRHTQTADQLSKCQRFSKYENHIFFNGKLKIFNTNLLIMKKVKEPTGQPRLTTKCQ